MSLRFNTLLAIAVLCLNFNANAQHKRCKTMELRQQRIINNPELRSIIESKERNTQNKLSALPRASERSVITIPVVVHVLYHNLQENISEAQIQSQLEILNDDFRMLNRDTLSSSHPFGSLKADSQIEFCLAKQDPNGNPTNGIIRKCTDSSSFSAWGYEKFTSTGGDDAWDPNSYLNIWVCNLGGSDGVLGYATFPSDLSLYPDEDGVVIHYENFGNTGPVIAPYHLGRTLTHEAGHWLNLSHIWGDTLCGNDYVNDTPPAEEDNSGCPVFPLRPNNTCGSNSDGEMFMNYMDYVDDSCMNMFTTGQANRMYIALSTDRSSLLSSNGCNEPTAIALVGARKHTASNTLVNSSCITEVEKIEIEGAANVEIYPNPSSGKITVDVHNVPLETNFKIEVSDMIGNSLMSNTSVNNLPLELNLGALSKGIYFITITNGDFKSIQKIILN